jgi:rRNA maturation protein Nop10
MTNEQADKKNALSYATTLARFSNLEPSQRQSFITANPVFFPKTFWPEGSVQPPHGTFTWQDFQLLVRKAWQEHFPPAKSILLISFSWGNQEVVEAMKLMMDQVHPYQEAILFLHGQSWRAAFCPKCGTRFVKSKPQQRFCSEKCFRENRKANKRAGWKEHGAEWRPSSKKTKTAKKQIKRGDK